MQPWPAEELEERAGEVAVALAALLTRQTAWRHRRVETITVLSHEEVRRAVSVDFTVPVEDRADLRLSEREWIVPLALLAKRPLVHFDLRDEAGAGLPLLRAEETRTISRELLYLVLDLDLGERPAPAAAGELVERVLAVPPPDAAELAAIDAALAALEDEAGAPLPDFAALAGRLARGFLLCAIVGDVDRRRVVKFAYDERLAKPSRFDHFYDAPGCTEAASYHVEVAVPDEMRARTTVLVDDPSGEVLAAGPRDADRPAIYYAVGSAAAGGGGPARGGGGRVPSPGGTPGLSVRYGSERGGFLVPAALVATLIAVQLGLPWLLADLGRLAQDAGAAVAILLSTSVVFSALVLRSGEHPLVRLVLAPYRACLALATVAALVAAGVLGFGADATALGWTWGVGALAAAVAAVILIVQALRAPSARTTAR